jgi:hypothetical protein
MFSSSVSFLNLQGNNINSIDMYAFYEYSKLAKVDLRNNSLRSLTEMSLSVSPRLMKPPVFLLGGNKLLCDCRLTWLRKQIQEWPLEDQQYVIEDMTSLTCEPMLFILFPCKLRKLTDEENIPDRIFSFISLFDKSSSNSLGNGVKMSSIFSMLLWSRLIHDRDAMSLKAS